MADKPKMLQSGGPLVQVGYDESPEWREYESWRNEISRPKVSG